MKKVGFLKFDPIFCLVIIGLTCLAWANRFIQDDAFVSFRYADNFVNGYGLVWNIGERIEGYTNFLWTMAISAALYFGIDPVIFSYITGMIFFVFSLFFTYSISLLIFSSRNISLLIMAMLGTNYSFSAYATGGLETQLQALLFTIIIYIILRSLYADKWDIPVLAGLSFLLAVAVLTRPDSALLAIVVFFTVILYISKEDIPASKKIIKGLSMSLPLIMLAGIWLVWKRLYYGDILPNTFYVKLASPTSIKRGLLYVYIFFLSYLLILFPLFGLISIKQLLDKKNSKLLFIIVTIFLWILYIIKAGGDFMEFRLFIPILPLLFILIGWLLFNVIRQNEVRLILIIIIFSGSLHHFYTFSKFFSLKGINPISKLHNCIKAEWSNWEGIGEVLGASFNYNPEVIIAVRPAGAIPYYSRLKTIDMLGLNDRWIARHGNIIGTRPGHQRSASFDYLLEQKVNFLIGHPWLENTADRHSDIYSVDELNAKLHLLMKKSDIVPVDSRVIKIPITKNYKLVVIYLIKSPIVDEAIKKYNWDVYPIQQ